MIATELGRKRHSVRDVRRTVRQGLWIAIMVSVPIWVVPLARPRRSCCAMGQEPELAALAGSYVRTLQWAVLPFYGYIVLRSFISALERPGWALVVVFVGGRASTCFANWCLMFGNLGFPALGLPGSGLATTISSTLMFVGLAAGRHARAAIPALPPVRPLLARRLAALPRAAGARPADRRHCSPSRCRSSTSPPS